MDRITCMQVFVKAVELGSIAAAAIDMDTSSQLAGRQIKALEASLGVRLLNRTTRRLSLTDGGRLFFDSAKNILAEMEAAQAQIDESRAKPRGKLRISAPITFGSRALAPRLAAYLRQHPEVTVELILSNRTVDLIEDRFDAAFRSGELPDSGLVAKRLAPQRLMLSCAPSYLKASAPLVVPQDLVNHECLVFLHTTLRTRWSFDGPSGHVSVPIRSRFATDSSEALREAAIAGMGIVLQPVELLRKDVEEGRLVHLLPSCEPTPRPLHVLYAPDRRMTPKLRSFLDFAAQTFGEPDPKPVG